MVDRQFVESAGGISMIAESPCMLQYRNYDAEMGDLLTNMENRLAEMQEDLDFFEQRLASGLLIVRLPMPGIAVSA